MSIQHYHITVDFCDELEIEPRDNGKWIKLDDIQKHVTLLKKGCVCGGGGRRCFACRRVMMLEELFGLEETA